jgi:ATP-binding cassette subfamily B protein
LAFELCKPGKARTTLFRHSYVAITLSSNSSDAPVGKDPSILLRLTRYLHPYRKLFIGGVAFTLLLSLFNPARPLLVQHILDNPVLAGDISALNFWIIILLLITLGHAVVMYFQTWLTNLLAQNIMNDLRNQVFKHVLNLRLQFFDRTPIGKLHTRTISDIETLNEVFSSGITTILGQSLQVFTILGVMFWINWEMTLVILTVIPLLLLATWIFRLRVQEAFNRVRNSVSELNAFTQEHISNLFVTQIFNREREEANRFDKLNRKFLRANIDTINYFSIFFPAVEFISAIGTALIVWYGASNIIGGAMTFGDLTAFIMLVNMFFRPIRMIAERFNTLQLGVVSAERVFKILDTEEFIPEQGREANDQKLLQEPQVDVAFEHVHFAYETPQYVLQDVSFEVPAGTTTAIVGATGAGKSSIINVLMRFYDIQSGEIRLCDRSIQHFTKQGLREAIGLVQQDVFLFSDSILENIRLHNPNISREQVQRAIELVGADQFIDQLPGGLDYQVGERGMSLSAGQRQLISFIRVMVYDPQVLLLDEATASIDTETEILVERAIAKVLSNRTSIIIAHRLSTIQRADQILVMHKGRIIERGTHQELLAYGGHYKKLYLLQYGKAEPV